MTVNIFLNWQTFFCLFMSYIEWLWSWNHQRETLMFYRSRQQMIIWKWAANEKHKTMNKKFSFSYYVCDFPILITSNTCKAANSCKAASVIKISCTTLENCYTTMYLFYHFYVKFICNHNVSRLYNCYYSYNSIVSDSYCLDFLLQWLETRKRKRSNKPKRKHKWITICNCLVWFQKTILFWW